MKLDCRKLSLFCLLVVNLCFYTQIIAQAHQSFEIKLGNTQFEAYMPLIKQKKVGLVGNQSSMVGKDHLLDVLLNKEVEVVRLFSPEHGFRGEADAGEMVQNDIDAKTNLQIVSLYGKNKKPSSDQLKGIEVLLFDIQDVGVRFYTYISTLHYIMEAAAENQITVIVLDRPNPNGFYVDGPILKPEFKSFVGMHPVPVVHGMTIGEYALMINGERWLNDEVRCDLHVIKMKGYQHNSRYDLPIAPSPNLPNSRAINLYPSLCFFEGTPISIGRGTSMPFQQFGHPSLKLYSFVFTPKSTKGAKSPKLMNQNCYGRNLSNYKELDQLELDFLIQVYEQYEQKQTFFTSFFDLLAGTDELKKQIRNGWSQTEIKESWKEGLEGFKTIRSKYLLYDDF